MLHDSLLEKRSGFRCLREADLAAIAGGHYNEDPIPGAGGIPGSGGSEIGGGFQDPRLEYFAATGLWVEDHVIAESLVAGSSFSGGGLGNDEAAPGTHGNGWIVVLASSTGDSDGNHAGTQATYDDMGSSACNAAGALASVSTWTGTYAGVLTLLTLVPDPSSPITGAAAVVATVVSLGTGYAAALIYAGNDCD